MINGNKNLSRGVLPKTLRRGPYAVVDERCEDTTLDIASLLPEMCHAFDFLDLSIYVVICHEFDFFLDPCYLCSEMCHGFDFFLDPSIYVVICHVFDFFLDPCINVVKCATELTSF